MALKKQTNKENNSPQEKRKTNRTFEGLITELSSPDIRKRRWAARDLSEHGEQAVSALLGALNTEKEFVVQEAILDTLENIGGEKVVTGLLPFLRSDNAALRNSVISVLQAMPESVALHIIDLLNDHDSDVRIFAIDILQVLKHHDAPQWLVSVLKDENHVNVIATAVDRLAEIGTPDMVKDLLAIKERFPDEPYLHFAVDTAISRINGQQ